MKLAFLLILWPTLAFAQCDPNDPDSPGYPCDPQPVKPPVTRPVKNAPEMSDLGCGMLVVSLGLAILLIRKRDKRKESL